MRGLRVVELGSGVAPAFCTRWLAKCGAEVVKVDSSDSDWIRQYRLVEGDHAALFRYLSDGKRLVPLDPRSQQDMVELRTLVETADLLVWDWPPERRSLLGVDSPRLVEVRIAPFGASGPYARYTATPIVLLALGGYQYLSGEPGRPPLALPGFQPEYLTGLFAMSAALAALRQRDRTGRGARVDVTALSVMAALHQFTFSQYLYQGTIRSRHGNRWENLYPITLLPCADGFVGMAVTMQDQWQRLCGMLGRPELAADPRFATGLERRANAGAIDGLLLEWLKDKPKREVFRSAQEMWRLPFGAALDMKEVLDDPQLHARNFWASSEAPDARVQPGLPFHIRTSARHTPPVAATVDARRELPLEGVRVLDFTRVWSGPLCTRILSDFGAEVIKIEAPLTPAQMAAPQPINLHELNRNKLSVVVDLQTADGPELVRRLVGKCNVLVENFSARVMPRFGLDYARLRALNPGLVMLSMPGFGSTGPYRDYVAYGPALEPLTGLTSLLGYPGEAPLLSAIAYPDAVAGLAGAAAVMLALLEQDRTGRGQLLDLSQAEATTCLLGEYVLAAQSSGTQPPRLGNRHPEWAPQGTYACLGKDQWVSISVRTDAEWRALCRTTGLTWLADLELAQRRHQHDELDQAVTGWTRQRSKFEAMHILQAAGVSAGAVLDAREVLEDPQLAALGFFVDALDDLGQSQRVPGTPVSFDGQLRPVWRAAPGRGRDGRRVMRELLDLTDAEIRELEEAGVLGRWP